MRYGFLILLFGLLMGACNGSGNNPDGTAENGDTSEVDYCDCNELAYDQAYNNFYLEKPRDGFTGLCESYFRGGKQLSLSKNFKDGKVHGEMITYYENGNIEEKKNFDMNFQSGDYYRYAEDGHLVFHVLYERGKQVKTLYSNPEF